MAAQDPHGRDGGRRPAAGHQYLAPGTVLQNGRYLVESLVGKGGMGAVYLVRDTHFVGSTPVLRALKEMVPSFANLAAHIDAFTREANMLATLKHRGIPGVHDSFTEQSRAYIVMDYVAGHDLQETLRLRLNMLTPAEVGDWMLQLCDIVHYLHTRQPPVIFRDLKPSNVILTPEGEIFLIDFGIAKIFTPEEDQTSIGTEGYAAPEQYEHKAESRSDIFSLGAMMHHLLTKTDPRRYAPFTFSERPPRALNPAVTPELEAVITRCLSDRPAERYQTVDELRVALRAALDASMVETDLTDMPTAPASGRRITSAPAFSVARNPRVLWRYRTQDEVRSTPVASDELLFIGSYDKRLYALDLRTGERVWHYTTEGGICSTPALWENLVIFGSEDSVVYALDQRTSKEAWFHRTWKQVRSSPRVYDDRVFIGSDDGHLYALDARHGQPLWKYRAFREVQSSPAHSDGLIFFGSSDEYLYAVHAQTGERKWAYHVNGPILSSPAVVDGYVYFGAMDFSVYCLEAKLGWPAWSERTNRFVVSSPCAAGDRLFIGSTDGSLYCLQRRTGQRLWRFSAGEQINGTPAYQNGMVYFGGSEGSVYCVEATTGKPRWSFQTDGKVPGSPCVRSGNLYVGSTDGWIYAIELPD